jgi:hypothetical protein
MKLSSGLLSTLLLIDPALGGKKNKNRSDSGLTGNQKLKKLLRDGFEITDFMYKAPVFDAAEGRGPTDERAPGNTTITRYSQLLVKFSYQPSIQTTDVIRKITNVNRTN